MPAAGIDVLLMEVATVLALVALSLALGAAAIRHAIGVMRIPARTRMMTFGALGLAAFAVGAAYELGLFDRTHGVEVAEFIESAAVSGVQASVDDEIATASIHKGVVYIQVPDMDRRFEAEHIWRAFRANGLRTPGIELVSAGSPSRAEVRYFNESDRPVADRVAAIASKLGLRGSVVRVAASYKAPEGQVEFWYPR